jgi:hypothetical protein
MSDGMRPEELIADIYSQLRLRRDEGKEPTGVLMNLKDYRLLEWYRNFLGEAENGSLEYLGQYEIFGLEILIENVSAPEVR